MCIASIQTRFRRDRMHLPQVRMRSGMGPTLDLILFLDRPVFISNSHLRIVTPSHLATGGNESWATKKVAMFLVEAISE